MGADGRIQQLTGMLQLLYGVTGGEMTSQVTENMKLLIKVFKNRTVAERIARS